MISYTNLAIAIFLGFNVMMAFRNHWVFLQRSKMSDYCFGRDAMEWAMLGKPTTSTFLPSYSYMWYHFWIWNASKFYLKPLDLDQRAALIKRCVGDFGRSDKKWEMEEN